VIPTELEQHIDKMFMTRDEMWFDSGKISERSRIVAILELEKDDCAHWSAIKHDWPADHDASCERCRPLNNAIARIKGGGKNV
jgi:hypothetical protein